MSEITITPYFDDYFVGACLSIDGEAYHFSRGRFAEDRPPLTYGRALALGAWNDLFSFAADGRAVEKRVRMGDFRPGIRRRLQVAERTAAEMRQQHEEERRAEWAWNERILDCVEGALRRQMRRPPASWDKMSPHDKLWLGMTDHDGDER